MPRHTGSDQELDFWRKFVHSEQFATWLNKDKPAPELDPEIVTLIKEHGGDVLDVGSGVVSILYGVTPNLIALDLLADRYIEIFDYDGKGIKPPLPIAAENINFVEDFDIVHMRNALDHCDDPMVVWENLKRAVAKGGLLIVAGFEKEGSYLHGLGMHQWDLWVTGDDYLMLRRQGEREPEILSHEPDFQPLIVKTVPLSSGRKWITWAGEKVL